MKKNSDSLKISTQIISALALMTPFSSIANSIVNGNFEDLSGMSYTASNVRTGVPNGWIFRPLPGHPAVVQVLDYGFSGSPDGGLGNWYLEGHTEDGQGVLSQEITGLTVGAKYRLDFVWGNRVDVFHPGLDRYNIAVNIADQSFSRAGSGRVDMVSEKLIFTATSTSHVLEIVFGNPGGATHTNGAIDDLKLTQILDPMIINSGFERISGMHKTTSEVRTGVPSGWQFIPDSGSEAEVQLLNKSFLGSPENSSGWYLEGHTENETGTLTQAINGLVVGQTYRLDFKWGNRVDLFHIGLDAYNFTVEIAGQQFSRNGTGLVNFTDESLFFEATSASHNLNIRFHNPGAETHTNGAFDDFRISIGNTPPVFYAGRDQKVLDFSIPIQLCRNIDESGNPDVTKNECRYHDDDGDIAQSYEWRFSLDGGKPLGSSAALSDPNMLSPIFWIDLHGTYKLEARAFDGANWSEFDEVIISTEDLPPIIDNIEIKPVTAVVGSNIEFCASSKDPNGLPTTHNWTITAPNGEESTQVGIGYCDTFNYAAFVGTQIGEYSLTLTVNDGSYPIPTQEYRTIVLTSVGDAIIEKVKHLISYVTQLPTSSFSNPKLAKPYVNSLNAILSLVDGGEYQLALDKIDALLKKTDDCTETEGKPKDWLVDCSEKETINTSLEEIKAIITLLL